MLEAKRARAPHRSEENERQGYVDAQPRHLLARPAIDYEAEHRPPHHHRVRDLRCSQWSAATSPPADCPDYPPYDSGYAQEDRDGVVHRLQDRVVVPRLPSALDLLLRQPVEELAEGAAEDAAAEVGEHARVERYGYQQELGKHQRQLRPLVW